LRFVVLDGGLAHLVEADPRAESLRLHVFDAVPQAGLALAKPAPRDAHFRGRVEKERATAAEAVEKYRPATSGKVDDLGRLAADMLRQLPGVAGVEVVPADGKPARRLIHLRDWHYVPRDLFALEQRGASPGVSEEVIDLSYQEHLLQVELLQLEHLALLRRLARRHGLRRVFVEGIIPEGVKNLREMVAALKNVEPRRREQLQDVQGILQEAKTGTERHARAKETEGEVLALLERFRLDVLPFGTAGRLLMSGDIEGVLPLDDAKVLEEARPIGPTGRFHLDAAKLSARHDGQVRAALKDGPFALVLLGGAHDLTESVRRHAGGPCQYVRVTTERYREFAGDE
jgi:hypothetical protein